MSEAKDWAGELISGQTGTGRILVNIFIYTGRILVNIFIYIGRILVNMFIAQLKYTQIYQGFAKENTQKSIVKGQGVATWDTLMTNVQSCLYFIYKIQ